MLKNYLNFLPKKLIEKSFLTVGLIFLNSLSFAQQINLDWANSYEGTHAFSTNGLDGSIHTDIASNGNIFTVGNFSGTVDVDPGPGVTNITSAGGVDIYLMRTNADGSLVWVKTFGGSANDFVTDIDIGGNGIAISGDFTSSNFDADPNAGVSLLPYSSNQDGFAIMLNTSGSLIFGKSFTGSGDCHPRSVRCAGTSGMYVTGYFSGTIEFGSTSVSPSNLTSLGTNDLFYAYVQSSGNTNQLAQYGGSGANVYGYEIEIEGAERYIAGRFSGTADFDPSVGVNNISASSDGFVMKINASGNPSFVHIISGGTSRVTAMEVNGSDELILAGYYSGTVDMDPNAGVSNVTSSGAVDAFISKWDDNGNFVWTRSFGGASNTRLNDIDLDNLGDIYTTGSYQGSIDLDPGTGTYSASNFGNNSIFFSKIDSNGDFVFGEGIGSTAENWGDAICWDPSSTEDFVISGRYLETIDFDPNLGISNLVAGSSPYFGFIAKYSPCTTTSASFSVTECTSYTVPSGDETHTTSGIYMDTIANSEGCDSILTISLTIDDILAPVADLATLPDATGECSVTPSSPTATDNCVGSITGTPDVSFPITSQGTTLITWTYDDGNGNTSTQTQNVVINDVTAPVPDNASLTDIIAECFATSPVAPTATDNCSGTVMATGDLTFPISTLGTHVLTWTYDDGNGNTSTQTQNIIIDDTTPPVPDSLSLTDQTAECSLAAADPGDAVDDCTGAIISGVPNVTFPITTQGTTVVVWSFTDSEGNTSTLTQNYIINDVTLPVVDVSTLSPLSDECSVTPTTPTATDNCAGTINGVPDATFPITTTGLTTITWTYTDNNNNVTTQTQNVTINDVTSPVVDIATLADINEECSSAPVAPTATDNCSGALNGVPDVTFPITTQGTTVVTWTYTDASGNTTTQTQNVIIDDITAPVPDEASLPAQIEECTGTAYNPTATDNCGGTINGAPDVTFPITTQGTTTVTWTYYDGNGNITTQTQDYVINDVTAPAISGCPSDIIIDANAAGCTADATWTSPTANDNCVGTVTPTSTHNSGDNFPIGTTTVTYTFDDGNGNSSTCNFDVTVENNMTLTANNTLPSCYLDTNGIIDITVVNGVAPFTFDWNSGTYTTEDLSNLGDGTYDVVVTDDVGCTFNQSYTLTEPTEVTLTIDATANPSACGTSDGTASITPAGGSISVDYNYVWSDDFGYASATQNPSDFGPGTYYISVSDDNGCTAMDTIMLIDPNAPDLAVDSLASTLVLLCNSDTDGEIDLTVGFNGGATSATFDWDNDGTGDTDDSEDLTALSAGIYNVSVVDNNMCTSTLTVEISEPSALVLSETNSDEIAGNDGSIDLTVMGGTPVYTYSWMSGQTTEDLTGLAGGLYTVTVTDDNGCTAILDITVNSQLDVENNANSTIEVYPNPTQGDLRITGLSEGSTLNLKDASGKLIQQEKIFSDQFEMIIESADGIYFLEVLDENDNHQIIKIVKK